MTGDLDTDFLGVTNADDLKTHFQYHPPKTQERTQAHEAVNEYAYRFAALIFDKVENRFLRAMAISLVQQARMLANQAITLDELRRLGQ